MVKKRTIKGRTHENNEDQVFASEEHQVIAVFDGMGGPGGGDIASRVARKELEACLLDKPREGKVANATWLQNTLKSIDAAVRKGVPNPDGGTTGTIALVVSGSVLVVNVGDSRCYSYTRDYLVKITDDDSYASKEITDALDFVQTSADLDSNELFDAFVTRNHLSQCLGHMTKPVVVEHKLNPEEILFVCSDGVHDNLTYNELFECLSDSDFEKVEEELILCVQEKQAAKTMRSKDDDVSVAFLKPQTDL